MIAEDNIYDIAIAIRLHYVADTGRRRARMAIATPCRLPIRRKNIAARTLDAPTPRSMPISQKNWPPDEAAIFFLGAA